MTQWPKLKEDAKKRWVRFGDGLGFDRVSWATLIVSAHVVDPETDWDELVGKVRQDFVETRRLWRAVINKSVSGVRWRGVFEIDLLRPDSLVQRAQKVELLTDLNVTVEDLSWDQRVVLPHYHAILDLGRRDVRMFSRRMRRHFRGSRRLLCQNLWQRYTLSKNIERLCDYSHKRRFEYSEVDGDGKTRFVDSYEPAWLSKMSRLHSSLEDVLHFDSSR